MNVHDNMWAWMRLAEEDLVAARVLAADEASPRVICGIAQQAAEKSLKAVLIFQDTRVPRTHNLKEIRARIRGDIGLEVTNTALDELTAWYMESRYPEGVIMAVETDALAAIAVAESVLETVASYLSKAKDTE